MTRQFAISPDVNVRNVTDWFILNTRLQRVTGEAFHATAYDDFADLHGAYEKDRADIVFANAADTTTLVRDRGYLPIAAPRGVSNEATVIVAADSPLRAVTDIDGRLKAAATDSPDVQRICRILLEPANIGPESLEMVLKRNPVMVAKAVATGEVEAGFLAAESFNEMSQVIRMRLRPLITSHISVVRHCLLASPALAGQIETIWRGLDEMGASPEQRELLAGLGAPNGWERLGMEDAAFMIDLMDALAQ